MIHARTFDGWSDTLFVFLVSQVTFVHIILANMAFLPVVVLASEPEAPPPRTFVVVVIV